MGNSWYIWVCLLVSSKFDKIMEIIDKKQIKNFIKSITIGAGIVSLVPLGLYFWIFRYGLSDNKVDWGIFGDFVGGIVGTIFSLLAVIFSLISIYISLKIAARIHDSEKELHKENIAHDNERFSREKNLIELQNKPFPHIDINRALNKIQIVISNQGPGTLVIKNWQVIYNDIEYKNYGDLLDKIFDKGLTFGHETSSKLIIATGTSKDLLDIFEDEFNDKSKITYCSKILINSKIKIEYEDIFENKFDLVEDLNDQE